MTNITPASGGPGEDPSVPAEPPTTIAGLPAPSAFPAPAPSAFPPPAQLPSVGPSVPASAPGFAAPDPTVGPAEPSPAPASTPYGTSSDGSAPAANPPYGSTPPASTPPAASAYGATAYGSTAYGSTPYGSAPAGSPTPSAPPAPSSGYATGVGYPAGYAGYGTYGGYGTSPYGQPYPAAPKTNGLAIASMVTSIAGIVLMICYGLGGVLGLVGAILGHVARKQIRERQEAGDGMALTGVIVGWISVGLSLLWVGVLVFLFATVATSVPSDPEFSGVDAIRVVLTR